MKAMHVSAAGLYKHMPRAGPHARYLPQPGGVSAEAYRCNAHGGETSRA
jgi:hypothetical protein